MKEKIGKWGMGCLKRGMAILPLIAMLMIGNVGATTINVNIQGLGDDLVLGKDYANFTIAITNATNLTAVYLYGGQNQSNLTELANWTNWGITGGAGYYNWTNLSDGVKYCWKVAVLDNGTWYNETGNFTIELSNYMVYITGEEAYKTWTTAGLILLGLALQGSKNFRRLGAVLLIIGIIAGIYWFNPLNIMGVLK
ncbi:MAG: hypothetical protein DRN29_05625 [Thermoplasmata archaeon]|nr:MAG: hypothetical protein DRN29_05625 [Thermoplasmata archaeon]